MPTYDAHQVANLVGQLGGDHEQAAEDLQLQGIDRVDPEQHADLLQEHGIDPRKLQQGGYQQHLDAQNQPHFQGYHPGADLTAQQPRFDSAPQSQIL